MNSVPKCNRFCTICT